MKKTTRLLSLIMAILTLTTLFSLFSSASDTVYSNMITYNVAGLPNIKGLIGMDGADVPANQSAIGNILAKGGYDIIAVQEDFGCHSDLIKGLGAYSYKTNHTGGIPGGDGMNIFSKTPIYNEKRTTWEKAYGVFDDGDELTPKGILYSVVEIGKGIYVDLYVIHADAFSDEGSIAARNDNYRQLAALIASKKCQRPIIITGDFNTSSHEAAGAEFTKYMIEQSGFKDSWCELYNDGNYYDFSSCPSKFGPSSWGKWDSVEKFLYKDGGGVHVEPTSFEYIDFNTESQTLSDHNAAAVTFKFEKTNDFKKNTEKLTVVKPNVLKAIVTKVTVTIKDLGKIITHLGDLFK